AQVPAAAVGRRPQPLLPPLHADRVLAAPDRGVPPPLGAAARRLRDSAALPAAAPARALGPRQRPAGGRRRRGRPRGLGLDGLHARDSQVATPPSAPPRPAAPG